MTCRVNGTHSGQVDGAQSAWPPSDVRVGEREGRGGEGGGGERGERWGRRGRERGERWGRRRGRDGMIGSEREQEIGHGETEKMKG